MPNELGTPEDYQVMIDWDADGFFCVDALPGDPLNIVPTPITWFDWTSVADSGVTLTREASAERYGLKIMRGVLGGGAASDAGYQIIGGTNIPTSNGVTYRVSVWVKNLTGLGTGNAIVTVSSNGGLYSASVSHSISAGNDWVRFDVAFTESEADYLSVRINRDAGTFPAPSEIVVTGLMVVTGSAYVGFNAGHPSNRQDNISGRVIDLLFSNGARGYDNTPDEGVAEIKVTNHDRMFSPEHTGTDLEGILAPARPVKIFGPPDSSQIMWAGVVENYQPSTNRYANQPTALITATTMKVYYDAIPANTGLLVDKRPDEIISALIAKAGIPAFFSFSIFMLNHPIFGVLNQQALANVNEAYSFAVSQQTVEYFGDNLVGSTGSRPSIIQAIQQVMDFEGTGLFFIDKTGVPRFLRRDYFEQQNGIAATFDDSMYESEYISGVDVVNRVEVIVYQRVPRTEAELVWSLPDNIVLTAGVMTTLYANLLDNNGGRLGVANLLPLTSNDVAWQSGGGTIRLFDRGQSVAIEITAGASGGNLAKLDIYGYVLESQPVMTVVEEDRDSINFYGLRPKSINSRCVTTYQQALDLARTIINSRKWVKGRMESITLELPTYEYVNLFDLQIGARVRVQEYQTAHDQAYVIVGNKQEVSIVDRRVIMTFYLRPSPTAWQIGDPVDIGQAGLGIGYGG